MVIMPDDYKTFTVIKSDPLRLCDRVAMVKVVW